MGLALKYFSNVMKRRCTMFLLSDFLENGEMRNEEWVDALKMAAGKHDVVALRLVDKGERMLPNLGLVKFYDPENGSTMWVDTSKKKVRELAAARFSEHEEKVDKLLQRYGVDVATLTTGEDFVKPLRRMFGLRAN